MTCETTLLNCATCSLDGRVCTQCKSPSLLVNGTCVSGPSVICVAPLVFDGVGCSLPSCPTGQSRIDGRCLTPIPNCVRYQSTNDLCAFCDTGFQVTFFGLCTSTGSILKCDGRNWFDRANDRCVPVDVSCDQFDENTGTCITCAGGYIRRGEQCVPEIRCNSRQFFNNGVCTDFPPGCSGFSPISGLCTGCVSNDFTLKDGACELISKTIVVTARCGGGPCGTCE